MFAVTLILILSATVFAMSLPFIVAGIENNEVAFGLPANNGIAAFLAIIFGLLIAALATMPFVGFKIKQRRK